MMGGNSPSYTSKGVAKKNPALHKEDEDEA